MDKRQLEILGINIVEKADNYLLMQRLGRLPARDSVNSLTQGLTEIRDAAKALYIEIAGKDPWKD